MRIQEMPMCCGIHLITNVDLSIEEVDFFLKNVQGPGRVSQQVNLNVAQYNKYGETFIKNDFVLVTKFANPIHANTNSIIHLLIRYFNNGCV